MLRKHIFPHQRCAMQKILNSSFISFAVLYVICSAMVISNPNFQQLGWKISMGLSPYSNPADIGVLCIILVNTAISISIIKEIVCSVFLGFLMRSWTEYSISSGSSDNHGIPSETYMEDFRNWNPSATYDSVCGCDQPEQECTVCLIEFKPNSEVNKLACGHIFHSSCLETWLKHWSLTCPLCRNTMISQEEHLSVKSNMIF